MMLAQALVSTTLGPGWALPHEEFYPGGRREAE